MSRHPKTGHRRRPPRRAYKGPWCIGHRAAVNTSAMTIARMGKARGGRPEDLFLGSEEVKPDKVPGACDGTDHGEAGPSEKFPEKIWVPSDRCRRKHAARKNGSLQKRGDV
jgi:hypothetical protein